MKSTAQTGNPAFPPVRRWKTLMAVAGAMALLCGAPVRAETIRFESIPAIGYAAGETISEGGASLLMLDGPFGGANGVVMDDSSCAVAACPAAATGNYLGILNDGGVQLALSDTLHWGFTLSGFDFAFIAPVGGQPNANYGRLQLSGLLADGSTLATALDFPGQDNQGRFMFSGASLDAAFRTALFKTLTINACMYDENLVCSNSLESPAYYTAQFALDNLVISAIPEPVSSLLLGLGMGALVLSRRRGRYSIPVQPTSLHAKGI